MTAEPERELASLRARVERLEDEAAIRRLMAAMMAAADDRDHPDYAARMAAFLYGGRAVDQRAPASATSRWRSAAGRRC